MDCNGKIKCPNCREEFNYFYLPYRNNDDDYNEPLCDSPMSDELCKAQMCLEWVGDDGIPEYTAHCPYCDWITSMPVEDAKKIPAFYFEKYLEQTD